MSLEDVVDALDARRPTAAVERVAAVLERIEAWQPHINAFIRATPELAFSDAKRVDERRAQGKPERRLDGVVVAIKDDIDVGGEPSTSGSVYYAKRQALRDAECVRRLRGAGAVIVGKLGLHELAYGATSNNPHFGAVRNPWDLGRVPGGSSGGSGAAVAADLCLGALGSDAGGSVRIPAALCGVSGLRPTYGSVSGRGSHPICYSVETIGPLARSARDVALIVEVLAGFDSQDPRSVKGRLRNVVDGLDQGVDGLRIGVLGGYFTQGLDPEIRELTQAAVDELATLGADLVDLELTNAEAAFAAITTVIVPAEALALHEELLEQRPDCLGDDVRNRLELGRRISGVQYARAAEQLRHWRVEVMSALERVDVLVSPTTPIVAPLIESAETISTTYNLAALTYPLSTLGAPALSVPCGMTKAGLPSGLQIVAAPWRDGIALRVGAAYQSNTGWHLQRPPEPRPGPNPGD